MEDKSNSLSRVKRHQREKVLRFSIRKYSFGAASVAVAALMFMGANVVSADSPSQNTSSSTTGLASPKDGEQSSEAGQARNENQAEVASEPSANNEAQPAEEKAATVDSSRLSKLVEEVSALLSTDSKHDSSVVSPIKERLQKGKELLARADAGQGELDSLAEDLEKDLAVLSRSSKEESQPQGSESADKNASSERSDHKEEGSDRAASASGAEDKPKRSRRSRRALESIPNTINEGALSDVRYFASVDPKTNNGKNTRNDDEDFTRNKTVIRARYQEEGGQKWMVYDVFFNNDGRQLVDRSYQQQYYFQAPFNIMHDSNTVKDLSFTRYSKQGGYRLSDGNAGFQQYGNTAKIDRPWNQKEYIFNNDYISLYDPRSGVYRDNQRWTVFRHNQNDTFLNALTRKTDGKYPNASYYLGIKVGKQSLSHAVHMHAKIRLKDNVTEEEAAKYGHVYAATTTFGPTTQQSYIVGAMGARLETTTEAETYPIKGSSHTKTVGDSLKDTNNPVGDGYITSKSGKDFPPRMAWSWKDNRKPSTAQAGVFTYKVIATYKDGSSSENTNSGSDGTVTLNVRPKKPTITTSVANKKGLTNQQITVNVGSGVKDGSIVKLYDGDKVIGEGRTQGQTAVVTVTDALPGSPITAETIVDNGGTVTSERSEAVTPTEAPDTQAPTLTITPASQTVTEGQEVTFTVTATDDKKAKLDVSDILKKYGDRFNTGKAFVDASGTTDTNQIRKITLKALPEDIGTHTITFKATDDAGHSAQPVTFTFTVTAGDKTGPTITAADATVTKNEPITPIPVTAVDNTGGVGLRDKDPIEVSNLPKGLKYENGNITGTPTGNPGTSRVTIKAYDKNGNVTTKTIDIVVQAQKDKYNPVGEPLTVNQGQTISDDAVKAKVKNVGPGTLTVQSKPTSTNRAGSAGNAVVKVTYPDGSSEEVTVPVTVKDVTGPTITANGATVTKNEPISPIKVTVADNEGGRGLREKNPVEVTGLPAGLTYKNGQITGTPTGNPGASQVTIKAYDKDGAVATKTITITVQDQASKYNPKGKDQTVSKNAVPAAADSISNKQNLPKNTSYRWKKTPDTSQAGKTVSAVVIVSYPDGSSEEVAVKVKVSNSLGGTVTAPSAVKEKTPVTPTTVVTANKPGSTITTDKPVNGLTVDGEGKLTGTPTVTDWGKDEEERKITIPVKIKNGKDEVTVSVPVTIQRDTDGDGIPDVTDPDDDNDGISDADEKANGTDPKVANSLGGTVTAPSAVKEKTPVTPTTVVTANKPGSTITTDKPVNGLTVDGEGKLTGTPTVTDWGKDEEERKITIPVKIKNGKDEVTVSVPVTIQRDTDGDGIPDVTDPDDDNDGISDADEKANGTDPKVANSLAATIELSQDPTTGDVTVTPKKPDGSTYPKGTKVEIPGKDGRPIEVTIGDNGSAKVPNDQLPDTTVVGKAKITEPGKAAVEVPNVTTPAKVTPATPTAETPGKIEIAQQPNGNAIVTPKKPDGTTYPSGTKVEIPGENGTTITVTIGDNGSGEVPNDKLPKGAVPGKGRVTEPNKKPSQPVDVTTPARKTPTVELSQDPTTGDVTVTPKKPDGSTYPEGTIVELPGKDGRPIKVTIGADGSAKVPNDQLPDTTVVGNAKITEPGKAAVEVPNVTTPAKVTVSTEQPSKSHNVLPNTGTESNATLASLGLLGMLSGLGFAFRKKKED
ncbi:YSIRK-type signal peptide-containing protein [Streptococcus pseudopneumoniae]|uniref:Rib/alpha-like domain-containing protein n=2 Tax=Streptococcus pseudopneumoniae TaxID=257758 RepID=UPI00110C3637|nr:Rib/alpha-like domain-containing protein [Streptococcus pseudopneumoniae]TMR42557.1 YSIRK-type signal peptide-containing protein [Streptococcus pseudopneumoniae]